MQLHQILKRIGEIDRKKHHFENIPIKKCDCGKYATNIQIEYWIDSTLSIRYEIKFYCDTCNYKRVKK